MHVVWQNKIFLKKYLSKALQEQKESFTITTNVKGMDKDIIYLRPNMRADISQKNFIWPEIVHQGVCEGKLKLYKYFILFLALGSHVSTQKISSHFEQNWRRDGRFCDWTKNKNLRIQNFIRNFGVSKGKIWLWLFYTFFGIRVSQFYTPNLKSFWAKLKTCQPFLWFSGIGL